MAHSDRHRKRHRQSDQKRFTLSHFGTLKELPRQHVVHCGGLNFDARDVPAQWGHGAISQAAGRDTDQHDFAFQRLFRHSMGKNVGDREGRDLAATTTAEVDYHPPNLVHRNTVRAYNDCLNGRLGK